MYTLHLGICVFHQIITTIHCILPPASDRLMNPDPPSQPLGWRWRRGSPDLIEQREDSGGVSLDQVQAALVVLVTDEGPLQPLGHVLLLGGGTQTGTHGWGANQIQEDVWCPIRYRNTCDIQSDIAESLIACPITKCCKWVVHSFYIQEIFTANYKKRGRIQGLFKF